MTYLRLATDWWKNTVAPLLPSINIKNFKFDGATLKAAAIAFGRFVGAPGIFVAQQFTAKVRPVTPQLAAASAVVWGVAIFATAFFALKHKAQPKPAPAPIGNPAAKPEAEADVKQDAPIADEQQEPPAVEQQEPPADEQQEPPAVEQQEPPVAEQQEPPAVEQQEPPADEQQEPPVAEQQEPPADEQQEPPAVEQQDAPVAKQQDQPPEEALVKQDELALELQEQLAEVRAVVPVRAVFDIEEGRNRALQRRTFTQMLGDMNIMPKLTINLNATRWIFALANPYGDQQFLPLFVARPKNDPKRIQNISTDKK